MNDIDTLREMMRRVQPAGKGQYIEEGRHLLLLERVSFKRTAISGTVKESYIAEFKVHESTNATHELGSTRSYVEATKNAGWDGRWMSFILAAVGWDPAAPTTPEMIDTFANIMAALRYDDFRVQQKWPENFLATRWGQAPGGVFLRCEGMPGTSRGGTHVTNKKWWPAAAPAPAGA